MSKHAAETAIDTFTALYWELDAVTSTNGKLSLLIRFLQEAPEEEVAWGLYLLCGGKVSRPVTSKELRVLAQEASALPLWLIEESYDAVGDLSETIALLVPSGAASPEPNQGFAHLWGPFIEALQGLPREDVHKSLHNKWRSQTFKERFIFTKLITGGLRIGVSKSLVIRAVSQHLCLDAGGVSHGMMTCTRPHDYALSAIQNAVGSSKSSTQGGLAPYPFALAHPITWGELSAGDADSHEDTFALGNILEWCIDWKWDGIRAQIVHRDGKIAIWTRGEEVVTEQFPELQGLTQLTESPFHLDGEIVAVAPSAPVIQPFATLQTRLNRKKITPQLISSSPVAFIPYDILELAGEDLRGKSTEERQNLLLTLCESGTDQCSHVLWKDPIDCDSWHQLRELQRTARSVPAEGVMLKKRSAPYPHGRKRGVWWKWKLDPFTVDAVLMYAQRGHGRRASLYTDYTFGLWQGDQLVPFAKAYSGLTDAEIREVNKEILSLTLEKFGPVRTVTPKIVCEIAFEGISLSKRHRSGIAVRFPRIHRLRRDKLPQDVDTVDSLKALIPTASPTQVGNGRRFERKRSKE